MEPFYAYLKYDLEHWTPYLITFANREVADEWWRMISTSPSPYAKNVERISPHFYIQNQTSKYDVACFFSNVALPHAGQFQKKMFFTQLAHGGTRLPITLRSTGITDHISGRWYFVRSEADSGSHWYLRTKGECLVCGNSNCDAIHVSSEYRTKFRIQVRNLVDEDSQALKDLVMIGKDEIFITASQDCTVHISGAEDSLKATKGYQGETDLLFNDLRNRFITRAEKQVNGEVWEYVEPTEKGSGEAWELVG